VLSKKVPYYEYIQDSQIRSALSQDELPTRPVMADSSTDEIDDESWELIMQCCILEPESRLKLADIQNRLKNLNLEDNRPVAKPLPGAEVLKDRYPYTAVDILRVGEILKKLKVSQRRAQMKPLIFSIRLTFPRSFGRGRGTTRTNIEFCFFGTLPNCGSSYDC
jgi:hypothetical protein